MTRAPVRPMQSRLAASGLLDIAEKLDAGVRLDYEDGDSSGGEAPSRAAHVLAFPVPPGS